MVLTYYTLRALADEWNSMFRNAKVTDAYSQARQEFAMAVIHSDEADSTLCARLAAPTRALYRRTGHGRARRNVASLFPALSGRVILGVRVAELDRHVYLDLEDGTRIQITPFGPRPNVYLTTPDGAVLDAFLNRESLLGNPAPTARRATQPTSLEQFLEQWEAGQASAERALSRALPLFDRTLIREVLYRSGIQAAGSAARDATTLRRAWEAADALERELQRPNPMILRSDEGSLTFSLVSLQHFSPTETERFDSVDRAVSVFLRRSLSENAFRNRFEPLRRALETEAARLDRSLQAMRRELDSASRADRYERWAHTLMAYAHDVSAGSPEAVLPDPFEAQATLRIPLDPARSAIENAEVYYEKARQTRASRAHARRRLEGFESRAGAVTDAQDSLRSVSRLDQIDSFEEAYESLLNSIRGSERAANRGPMFRRFRVSGGYEVMVGRNAAQNDILTFRHASKHDLWLHARGVSGSHVVMRVPGKSERPSRRSIEEAAAIAAHFSKASGSELVPVIVTQRKFVRKAKKAPPGTVIVEREEVVIVPPGLPAAPSGDVED